MKVTELTAGKFMAEVESLLQSNEDFVIDSGLIIEVTLVDMHSGGIGKRCKYGNMQKKCKIENPYCGYKTMMSSVALEP